VAKRRVGVIATAATVRSGAYPRRIAELRPDLEVLSEPCPLFVPLVEEGWYDDPVTEEVARRYLAPLLAAGIDTLVLGCTHYPLLAPLLARIAGPDVTLVDSAESVAAEVAEGLAERGLLAPPGAADGLELCVTDAGAAFAEFAARILGEEAAPLEWVEVA
jgi:glutamate racemase